MSPLWTAAEAAAATGGIAHGSWTADEVGIDTRALPPRALFVALEGEHRDGHAFVPDALAKGAAAMVARRSPDWPIGAPLLEVDHTLRGLEALGRAARQRSAARIAAVTGSVGKTSIKEALRQVLSAQAPTHASAASHNNHWGVPLSLARLPAHATFGVFELGMNHAGEIAVLAPMVRPHVALVTRIAPAHLAMLGSLDAIADAKAEIFSSLEPDGVAILPADDAQIERLGWRARNAGARIVTFGQGAGADWRLLVADLGPESSAVTVAHDGQRFCFTLGAPGAHWAMNAVAVLATVAALGGKVEAAAAALAAVRPPAGRGARRVLTLPGGTALLLDESYNANPTSMAAAFDVLGRTPGRRLVALGDMLELGPAGPTMHADLAGAMAAAEVELVFTCGPLMAELHNAVPAARRGPHVANAAVLAPLVAAALRPGDVLLVKGSLGSRMKTVVEAVMAAAQGGS